jgi:hypothetical protein
MRYIWQGRVPFLRNGVSREKGSTVPSSGLEKLRIVRYR